ncbi:MAG TPA: PKD-like family lipoprotein [Prevotella sp.]
MKKYILFIFVLGAFFSCVKDDSEYGDKQLFIHISGLAESYNITSFSNKPFTANPTVETSFDNNDLEYKWTYFSPQNTGHIVDGEYQELTATKIADTPNISYPVTLADGTYFFVFTVTSKSTGYSQSMKTSVHVASALSKGFIILKENGDGNTDYDVYNTDRNELIENVIKTAQGQSLSGKPRAIDVNYGKEYINRENNQIEKANMLCITTESNKTAWVRAMDGKTVINNSNCFYEPIQQLTSYRSFSGMFTSFYITSNGIYGAGHGGFNGGSGVFGAMSGNGGSTHVISIPSLFGGLLFWNEQQHAIQFTDYNNANHAIESTVLGHTATFSDYDCLSCGVSLAGGETIFFLLQHKEEADKKLICYIECPNRTPTLAKVTPLDASTHFAKATCRAVNANFATMAYGVDNNKVYTYDLVGSNPEKELSFNGLPANEQIVYLSNRYLKADDGFDYLMVGTQNANTYKVYMYKMIGGEPTGEAQQIIQGEGKIKGMDYLTPTVDPDNAYQIAPILDH